MTKTHKIVLEIECLEPNNELADTMNNATHEQLQEVFRKVFKQDDLVITNITSAKDIKGWDSFMHIELITAIETDFNVTFSFNEVIMFNAVGDMLKKIEEKIKT